MKQPKVFVVGKDISAENDVLSREVSLPCAKIDFIVKWSCCSALRFNNHRTTDTSGNKLKFYRLPRSTELQREYSRILQTTGINWNSAYICSQHWSKGFRENVEDLPDVPAHESQIARPRIKLEKARRRNNTSLAKVLSRKIYGGPSWTKFIDFENG